MGKLGLLDELGDVGTVCPSFWEDEDPGVEVPYIGFLKCPGKEYSAKDRFKVELEEIVL